LSTAPNLRATFCSGPGEKRESDELLGAVRVGVVHEKLGPITVENPIVEHERVVFVMSLVVLKVEAIREAFLEVVPAVRHRGHTTTFGLFTQLHGPWIIPLWVR
jgi:hypothetical protein